MNHFNGQRLKNARVYRGLTIETLASELNITKQAVSQYENSAIYPDFEKIIQIAAVLHFPPEHFMQTVPVNLSLGSTYFRSLMKTSNRYRQEQIVKIGYLGIIYRFLREYIEFPQLNIPNSREYTSPEEAAKSLREHWGLGTAPISNIIRLVEQNGCIVSFFDTKTDDIDAFSQYINIEGQDVYLIALSKNKDSAARIHFDVAHEIGHILLHPWSDDIESLTREQFKAQETEANRFAAAFLLPVSSFSSDAQKYSNNLEHYALLKKKWKTSIGAMLYRSRDLGLISQYEYQNLIRIMQRKNWRKNEPLDDTLITAGPSLLKDAIDILITHNVFSSSELMEQLSQNGLAMFTDEVEALLDLPEGTLRVESNNNHLIQLRPRLKDSRK